MKLFAVSVLAFLLGFALFGGLLAELRFLAIAYQHGGF